MSKHSWESRSDRNIKRNSWCLDIVKVMSNPLDSKQMLLVSNGDGIPAVAELSQKVCGVDLQCRLALVFEEHRLANNASVSSCYEVSIRKGSKFIISFHPYFLVSHTSPPFKNESTYSQRRNLQRNIPNRTIPLPPRIVIAMLTHKHQLEPKP